jgi:hypothetical protein
VTLPEIISPGDTGHIGHHQTIHGLVNALDSVETRIVEYHRVIPGNVPLTGGVYRWTGNGFVEGNALNTASSYWIFRLNGADLYNHVDEAGWIGTVDRASTFWNGTVPAGTYFTLPKGIYAWFFSIQTTNAAPVGHTFYIVADYVDNPPTGASGFGGYYQSWNTTQAIPQASQLNPAFTLSGGFLVSGQDGQAFLPEVLTQPGSTGFGTVKSVQFGIIQLAGR